MLLKCLELLKCTHELTKCMLLGSLGEEGFERRTKIGPGNY